MTTPKWKLNQEEKIRLAGALLQALGIERTNAILSEVLGASAADLVAGKKSPTKVQYKVLAAQVLTLLGWKSSYALVINTLGRTRLTEIVAAYSARDLHDVFLEDVAENKPPPSYNATLIPDLQNRLLHPGRQITWQIPGKGRFWQYDSGYIRDWFAANCVARFEGHCQMYEFITGDKSMRAAGPHLVSVETVVHNRITHIGAAQTPVDCRFADTNEPTSLPDKVSWKVIYPARHSITFSHSHHGDAMSVFAEIREPSGASRVHFPCNHTIHWQSLNGPRLDIRYLHVGKPPELWTPKHLGR